jgi:2'-5' RNA ligase
LNATTINHDDQPRWLKSSCAIAGKKVKNMAVRRQATLYLPKIQGATIERLRAQYNPAQAALIRAHITLCREDEVDDWDDLADRIRALATIDIDLFFGQPIRNANLVYLPTAGATGPFDSLRELLLSRGNSHPRKHDPHLTLIHPRNGICTAEIFAALTAEINPMAVNFKEITLIEQTDGGAWRNLQSFGES